MNERTDELMEEKEKAQRLVDQIHNTEDRVLVKLRELLLHIRGEEKDAAIQAAADRPHVSLSDLLQGYGVNTLSEFTEHACQLIDDIDGMLF